MYKKTGALKHKDDKSPYIIQLPLMSLLMIFSFHLHFKESTICTKRHFLPLFSGFCCCLFLIVLRDNETSCQTKIRKAKTCLAY